MSKRPLRSAGFTLVEMLIALTIFGMLTAGGVALLSFSVTSQEMTERQLATLGSIRRAGALLTADLAQAAPRPWRDEQGRQQPAFWGAPGQESRVLVLVRAGWDNPEQLPRSSLQRVEYRLQGGRLLRIGYTNVDGGGAAAVTTLIEDVQQLNLRFRDRDGAWRADWQPPDPSVLPVAIELTVSSERFGPVRQLFLVGGGL
jgi:general secretion pathway protein J